MEREAHAQTVVLIHGLWMTPLSWEHWVTRYEQRGLKVLVPGYPGIEPGTVKGVRAPVASRKSTLEDQTPVRLAPQLAAARHAL